MVSLEGGLKGCENDIIFLPKVSEHKNSIFWAKFQFHSGLYVQKERRISNEIMNVLNWFSIT